MYKPHKRLRIVIEQKDQVIKNLLFIEMKRSIIELNNHSKASEELT